MLGGGDWQYDCCLGIHKRVEHFYAAIPTRYKDGHALLPFKESGDERAFDRQLSWERHYLQVAAHRGCLIFWLRCESKTNPRNDGKSYAMDARGELGEWRGQMMGNPNLHVVVGAEKDFPGLSQIERNFKIALGSEFPIYPTLDETIEAAIKKAG